MEKEIVKYRKCLGGNCRMCDAQEECDSLSSIDTKDANEKMIIECLCNITCFGEPYYLELINKKGETNYERT